MKTQTNYSLKYYSGNRLIETVMDSNPLPLIKWFKRQCELTTHKSGVLRIEKNDRKKIAGRNCDGILTKIPGTQKTAVVN